MKLFIYCAGGFGKEIFDTVKRINQAHALWSDINFIDDTPNRDPEFYNAKLFSFDALVRDFDLSDLEIVIANGEPASRKIIYDKLMAKGIKLGRVVDNSAIISDTATIGAGAIVTSYCSVSSLAKLGENVAINAKAIVGHDVSIGAHTVISSLVNVGGASTIGENSYIGMGVQIKEQVAIGNDVIVGMGSVVFNDIPDGMIALGNPARPMRKNVDKRVFSKN